MDVSEISSEGLKRELKVVVPAAELQRKLDEKLKELAKTVQLPGFRPGKVPPNLIRKMHGERVMAEVVEEAMRESMEAALKERDLRAAYQPDVALEGGDDAAKKIIAGEADLAYTMTFEILPEVEVPEDFSDMEFTRYQVKVADEEIDRAIENIAGQFKDWEEKDGAAEKGDRVIISFVGRVDGEEFEGGKAENVPLELGSGQFIPGFEDQLIGAKAGEERVVKVTFPEDYGAAHLAGKEAEFTVTVERVESAKEAELNDEFARKLGLGGMDELRQRVSEQLGAEYAQAADMQLKQDVLDALADRFDFPVPEKLVEYEFEQIWHALQHQMEDANTTFEDEGTTEEEARKEYRKIAERRVRLGLVVGAIGEKAGVQISDEEMQQALLEKARQYPGQEREVIEYYQKTPEALIELRGPIYEAKVVDHIVNQAKVAEREVTPEELNAILEGEEEAKEEAKAEKKTKGTKKKPATKKSAAKKSAGKKKTASGKKG